MIVWLRNALCYMCGKSRHRLLTARVSTSSSRAQQGYPPSMDILYKEAYQVIAVAVLIRIFSSFSTSFRPSSCRTL
jgi:hypothetical protein